jgi:hypothetical protein
MQIKNRLQDLDKFIKTRNLNYEIKINLLKVNKKITKSHFKQI